MAKIDIDETLAGKTLFDFLIANKSALIAEKKFTIKLSDAFTLRGNLYVNEKGEVVKGLCKAAGETDETSQLNRSCVINTTNWMDSHKDVHIPGIWKKSLQENKDLYLLQEHSLTFKGIITDKIKAYTKKMTWRSLGLNIPGETEALIFDATLAKTRNEYMFNEYRLGHVKNHSVGMRYVVIEMAINDEDYKEEFAVWNKYIGQIANVEEAEASGYFWAVKEAKVIEGSAVPIGSNIITPTLEDIGKDTLEDQPLSGTGKTEPSLKTAIDWDKIASKF
jgi:hypothetical protein